MKWILSLLIIAFMCSCSSVKNNGRDKAAEAAAEKITLDFTAGPTTYVYKTTKDFSNHVPVMLTDDKTDIASYPHPTDVYYQGKLAKPYTLENDYLLDNRGIGANVAFLKLTYEEYAELEEVPSKAELMEMVIDKDPLLELYHCGNRHHFKDEKSDLNTLIKAKMLLKKCKQIK